MLIAIFVNWPHTVSASLYLQKRLFSFSGFKTCICVVNTWSVKVCLMLNQIFWQTSVHFQHIFLCNMGGACLASSKGCRNTRHCQRPPAQTIFQRKDISSCLYYNHLGCSAFLSSTEKWVIKKFQCSHDCGLASSKQIGILSNKDDKNVLHDYTVVSLQFVLWWMRFIATARHDLHLTE